MKQLLKFMQVLLLGLLWAGTQSMAVTVTIGTGTTTATYPYYTLYEDSRTQMLYTASEITAGGGMAGNIQSIALNVSSANTLAMNGFNIRMQNTSAISLTGFVTTGWTTVYSGVYSVPGTGWQTIMLQTPFAWDGTSNLLIEICFDNTSWSGNSSVYSTAATNMTWHYHTDGASGCSLTGGSTYSNRPNIQLEITPAITSVTIEIGTGTNTSYRVPWNHFYQYSRTQTIYQQAEINTLGQIQKIYYHVASWPASYTYTQLKIWMGTTTLPSWTATTQWIDNATLTLVYDGPITITSPGWLEIPLQTPFTYNNTENLVISIHEPLNVPSYAGSTYTFYYSTALTNRYLDGYSDSQSWPTSLYMSNYLPNIKIEMLTGPNIPGTLAGVVTNAATGLPVIGAKIQAGDSITYSAVDGSYSMPLPPITIPTVTCSKLGYDVVTINDVEITSCTTTNQNFTLQENTNPPSVVYASLNTAQTAVNITWGLPQGPYEIVYDDGQFENMTAWAVEGNINALKFTPINSYPVQIIGGKVHIGDGSYPSGADLQTFTMAVYDDDGTMGLPNTELATVEVTPTHYGWVEFTFPTPITITSGNFYIGMIQGGNYPNCVPIAIDETNPSMRSYSKFVTGNGPWVPAGYNDFMIRASVIGAGGPLDLATGGNQPAPFIEKHRENTGTYALKIPRLIGGQEGEALYIPIPQNGDNSDVITGYQVWRLKQGEETNPAVWVSIGTPTSTNITDNSWPTLPNGAYRWAVKAKYTGNRWSDASFSNVLGKGWTANVTFNITMCSSTVSPQGATVSLTNTQYPDTAYFAVAPANGIVTFPHVWKGNYDIAVVKFPFNSWTLNDDINGNKTYNVLMKEMTFPPKNMTVDDLSLIATWNAARINLVCFEEQWNSGSFATQGWTTSGGSNWGISTSTGNPAPSAQFNWSPSVTNYSQTLTSPDITGIGSPGLTLEYDYYLNNFSTATLEELAVEIWDGTTWNQLAHYVNTQGSIPWTHQSININAYTNSTFKIRFRAYGQNCYNINYWNIDNIRVVGSAKAGRDLVGYNVYLNDIQIGFTTDTTYQIPQNLCTYGQTYTACVEAAYECGVSQNSCYTFTAHYLPAPRNLEATPIQDAAYLTWDYPVVGGKSLQIGIPGMSTESVAEEAN
ncbi:MAG: carboxypeptidase regulatory-like domain-containing protein, partial [Bacteroidales bacterium]|nr:carboxypeptidase regulatory-like domain-containing protein [Bacteroidales bacterium]